jgi:hypothetical protein
MTGIQIKTLAETHLDGDTIADADALAWINECVVGDLGRDSYSLKSATLVQSDTTTWNDLPADFGSVHEIEYDNQEYTENYRIRGSKILFQEAGTFTLWYYAIPAEITALTETPGTHQLLHKVISLFLASRFKSQDDDENQDAIRLMNEYTIRKKNTLIKLGSPMQDSSPVIEVV